MLYQASLFTEAPGFDPSLAGLVRTDLGAGAWIDHLPGWIKGHEAMLEALWTTTAWLSVSASARLSAGCT